MNEPAPAIVVGLDCITGLQTARILSARGVPVIGVAADGRHFACLSRSVRRVVVAPTTGEPLIAAVQTAVAAELDRLGTQCRAVLFPCTDGAVATLSAERERLPARCLLGLSPHETVQRLMNKRSFYEYAVAQELPIPRTMTIHSREDVQHAAAVLTFPVALKPALKSARWLYHTGAKAFQAADAAELLWLYDASAQWADELIVQEWVVGGEDCLYSCNAYFGAGGEPLATFVARKLRQWPLDTGTSCLGEEVRNDEVLAETLRLFKGADFRGLAYLEMKRDARTDAYAIIEPNIGRPTGRSAIAEAGGVELIMTAYRDALGEPLPAERTQSYGGATWIYGRHDLQAAWAQWRRGDLGIGAYLRSIRGRKTDAVWSLRDPAPCLFDYWRTVRKCVRRRGRGRRGVRLPRCPSASSAASPTARSRPRS